MNNKSKTSLVFTQIQNENNKIIIKITKHKSKMRKEKRREGKRNAQPRLRLKHRCKPVMESLQICT